MTTDIEMENWELRAITQLRARFLEEDDHWVAIFENQVLYEDKREWYVFLISQEGYGR